MKIAIIAALLIASPTHLHAANDSGQIRRGDLVKLDQWLRIVSRECGKLGFTQVDTSDPTVMEKRMHAHLLLKPSAEAMVTADRWASYVIEMRNLSEPKNAQEAGERAGAALAAASIDPTTYEVAKQQYIEAIGSAFRPFLAACTSAAADPFLSANYVSGAGSLAPLEPGLSDAFDSNVRAAKAKEDG